MLFIDGIRNIRFEEGLTYNEIDSFLDAVKMNSLLPQEERDIVSLFWERDFINIKYFAVEEIPDQESTYVDESLNVMETVEFTTGSIELDEREITELSGQAKFEPFLEMKTYEQREIDELMETIQHAKTFDAKGELIEIIFEILRLETVANANFPVLKILDYYIDELLIKSEFTLVSRTVKGLRELLEY